MFYNVVLLYDFFISEHLSPFSAVLHNNYRIISKNTTTMCLLLAQLLLAAWLVRNEMLYFIVTGLSCLSKDGET